MRASYSRGCGGRGLGGPPGPPTVWVAGLTADLSRNWEGEVGQMRGFPLVGGFLRVLAASRWSGGPRPLGGGQRFSGHLTISDVYWMILDALLFLITSPGKAGLRVQTGDTHTRDAMARRAGVPRR